MKKQQAIQLLGGTATKAADAIRINPQAISQWPDHLPPRLADRVIAACVRGGISIPIEHLSLTQSQAAPKATQFPRPPATAQEAAHG